MKKKNKVLILSIIGVLLIGIAISFAYWQIILKQENPNVVTSECFQINFTESEGILLNNAHPISDEEGETTKPYEFTITNVCNSSATYQINLETFLPSGKQLPEKYLKVSLMENTRSVITTKLLNELETEPSIEDAISSYKLLEGVLASQEEKEFHLRIWMHSEVTASDLDSMNAIFEGKVSVVTSFIKTAADTIKNLPIVTSGNGLYEVGHEEAEITYTEDVELQNRLKQTEYRYAGKNPDNYVKFNNELWRIIGLVNTPEGQRVKIIRNESIGDHSWDSSESSINNGWGVNEWSQSKLMNLLNHGAYYDRNKGICYNGANNATTECDFSSTGLLEESKNMIDTITWNTGSNDGVRYTNKTISTINFYNLERSKNIGKICNSGTSCNDNVSRTTVWKGQVGLMYSSDYGYATSGGNTTNRTTCLSRNLYDWYLSNLSFCKTNNWLYQSSKYQWTLAPGVTATTSNSVFSGATGGYVVDSYTYIKFMVFPSLYLKSNIRIIDGNGTIANPYELNI